MKRANLPKAMFIFLLIVFLVFFPQNALCQESAEELYEAGLFKKEAEGDLAGAVQIFTRIITDFPENKKLGAKAQLQIAMCYEKLGLAKAQKAYQNVINNYPHQAEEITIAREKLSRLLRAQAIIEKGDKEFKLRQVWAGPGVDLGGSPSPDGRYLSYVDWETGDLAIYEIATGKKNRLTNEGTWEEPSEFALYSRISPDSKQVAYSWWNLQSTYDLRLVGIDGSGRCLLYGDEDYEVYPSQWSSDGKKIAIKRHSRKDDNWQIVWISVEDGSVQELKTLENGQWTECICHSPDDRFIAYDRSVEEDSGNYDIYFLSTEGNSETPLVKHPANDKLLGWWAPGRKDILFLSDRSGTWDAFLIQVENGKPLGSPRRIKGEIGQAEPLGFTQDGSYYFGLITRWSNTHIASLDLSTGELLAPIKQPIVGSSFNTEWSPDGEYLAYVTEKTLPEGLGVFEHVLHIRSLQTGKDREVVCELRRIRNPRWSPDGRSIVVTGTIKGARPENYQGGLYQIDIQSGEVNSLVEYAFEPPIRVGMWGTITCDWAPDGKAVFYITRDNILMKELESGQVREIYNNPNLLMTREPFRPFAVSPDGRSLVFGLRDAEKDTHSLMIMPVFGGEPRELLKLSRKNGRLKTLAWTPEGEYILFTKRVREGVSLERISPEGGKPQNIWLCDKDLRGLRLHPDGQRIAFSTRNSGQEVWVMENFLK